MYDSSYMFRHYIAIFRQRSWCFLRDAQLRIVDSSRVSRWTPVGAFSKDSINPQLAGNMLPAKQRHAVRIEI
jgi:hypothetical protein